MRLTFFLENLRVHIPNSFRLHYWRALSSNSASINEHSISTICFIRKNTTGPLTRFDNHCVSLLSYHFLTIVAPVRITANDVINNCSAFVMVHLQSRSSRSMSVFVRAYVDKKTIWTIRIVLILATGIPTALAAHTQAYWVVKAFVY